MLGMMLIPLALATATATVTLTKAKVTEPLRRRVLYKVPFIKRMMECLYCTSHWVAAAFVIAVHPDIGTDTVIMDLIVAWLAVVALSAVGMYLINWSHGSMQWTKEGEE